MRRLRRQLQQQALAQIACADARRIELLHDVQRFLDLAGGRALPIARGQFFQAGTAARGDRDDL